MLKQITIAVLLIVLCGLSAMGQDATIVDRHGPQANRRVVPAAQINGTFRSYENELRILALGHNN